METSSPSLVSVIIAVYNDVENILSAIKSVIGQTYPHWELIIVNDASTDNTHDTVKTFLAQAEIQSRYLIRYLLNDVNVGTYVSFNRAIQIANGDYLCVLGSDDLFDPRKLELQVRFLDNFGTEYIGVRHLFTRNGVLFEGSDNEASLLFRRKIVDEIGYFDSVRFSADSEFIYRLYNRYGHIPTLQKVLYYAKKRENSLTTDEKSRLGSPARAEYVKAFTQWHSKGVFYLPFPIDDKKKRPFPAPEAMLP